MGKDEGLLPLAWQGLPPTHGLQTTRGCRLTYSLESKLLADILTLSVKKQMHCVMFFGTNDYAWIEEVLCCGEPKIKATSIVQLHIALAFMAKSAL